MLEGALLGGVQVDARDALATDLAVLEGLHGLEPARRAQAPLAPTREANGAQVVALGGRVPQEFVAHDAGHGVVALVLDAGPAEAIAVEARHGLGGEELEGLLEDCVVLCWRLAGI